MDYFSELEKRMRRLEDQLDMALRLLRGVAAFLERTHGAEAVGPEVLSFIAAFASNEADDTLVRIDGLVAAGKEPEAVRLIRDATGETWDQAFQTYGQWLSLSQREKERKLHAVRLRRPMKAPEPPGH
jgi:hypothetical protein